LGWTYLFWVPAAIISTQLPDWSGVFLLHLLGGIGPLIASAIVVAKTGKWKQFGARIVNVKGFCPVFWLLILAPLVIAVIASVISNGEIRISEQFAASGLVYAISLLFFGPIPEEVGWRGVLFDEFARQSITKAQVITACIWLIWHLPLFFVVGSYQHGVGFGSVGFIWWCIGLILQSIIMGVLYLLTNRSIASAILFHYFVNLAGEMIEKNDRFEWISLLLYGLFAITLVYVYKTWVNKGKIQQAEESIGALDCD
jgi:membrane protease YdiL (CAAX protease family)